MINIILFFFPAAISLIVKEKYFKEKLNNKEYALLYIKYNVLINLISFGILTLYSFGNFVSISYSLDTLSFVFKYLVMTFILSLVVPVLDEYFKKNIDIKLEIRKIEVKNEKRKTKKKIKNIK